MKKLQRSILKAMSMASLQGQPKFMLKVMDWKIILPLPSAKNKLSWNRNPQVSKDIKVRVRIMY